MPNAELHSAAIAETQSFFQIIQHNHWVRAECS